MSCKPVYKNHKISSLKELNKIISKGLDKPTHIFIVDDNDKDFLRINYSNAELIKVNNINDLEEKLNDIHTSGKDVRVTYQIAPKKTLQQSKKLPYAIKNSINKILEYDGLSKYRHYLHNSDYLPLFLKRLDFINNDSLEWDEIKEQLTNYIKKYNLNEDLSKIKIESNYLLTQYTEEIKNWDSKNKYEYSKNEIIKKDLPKIALKGLLENIVETLNKENPEIFIKVNTKKRTINIQNKGEGLSLKTIEKDILGKNFVNELQNINIKTTYNGNKIVLSGNKSQILNKKYNVEITPTNYSINNEIEIEIPEKYSNRISGFNEIDLDLKELTDYLDKTEILKDVNININNEILTKKSIPENYEKFIDYQFDNGKIETYINDNNQGKMNVLLKGYSQFNSDVYNGDDYVKTGYVANIISEDNLLNSDKTGFSKKFKKEIKEFKNIISAIDTILRKEKYLNYAKNIKFLDSDSENNIDIVNDPKKYTYNKKEILSTFKDNPKEKIEGYNLEAIKDFPTNQTAFVNNTNMMFSRKEIKFIENFNKLLESLKLALIKKYNSNYFGYDLSTQVWGVGIDKSYSGINIKLNQISVMLINFLDNYKINSSAEKNGNILYNVILREIAHNFIDKEIKIDENTKEKIINYINEKYPDADLNINATSLLKEQNINLHFLRNYEINNTKNKIALLNEISDNNDKLSDYMYLNNGDLLYKGIKVYKSNQENINEAIKEFKETINELKEKLEDTIKTYKYVSKERKKVENQKVNKKINVPEYIRKEAVKILEISFPNYLNLASDINALPLIANIANMYAKTINSDFYSSKEIFLEYLSFYHPNSWSLGDGILYIETPQGQVSFHVFNNEDTFAMKYGMNPIGRTWSGKDNQMLSELLLINYIIENNIFPTQNNKLVSNYIENIQESFDKNPNLKSLKNLVYQKSKDEIIEENSIKAGQSLIESIKKGKKELPLEYISEYIEWFRNTILVQVGISTFKNKENLINAIKKEYLSKKGEAYTWYKNFSEFIREILTENNGISILKKEEIKSEIEESIEKLPINFKEELISLIKNNQDTLNVIKKRYDNSFNLEKEELLEFTDNNDWVKGTAKIDDNMINRNSILNKLYNSDIFPLADEVSNDITEGFNLEEEPEEIFNEDVLEHFGLNENIKTTFRELFEVDYNSAINYLADKYISLYTLIYEIGLGNDINTVINIPGEHTLTGSTIETLKTLTKKNLYYVASQVEKMKNSLIKKPNWFVKALTKYNFIDIAALFKGKILLNYSTLQDSFLPYFPFIVLHDRYYIAKSSQFVSDPIEVLTEEEESLKNDLIDFDSNAEVNSILSVFNIAIDPANKAFSVNFGGKFYHLAKYLIDRINNMKVKTRNNYEAQLSKIRQKLTEVLITQSAKSEFNITFIEDENNLIPIKITNTPVGRNNLINYSLDLVNNTKRFLLPAIREGHENYHERFSFEENPITNSLVVTYIGNNNKIFRIDLSSQNKDLIIRNFLREIFDINEPSDIMVNAFEIGIQLKYLYEVKLKDLSRIISNFFEFYNQINAKLSHPARRLRNKYARIAKRIEERGIPYGYNVDAIKEELFISIKSKIMENPSLENLQEIWDDLFDTVAPLPDNLKEIMESLISKYENHNYDISYVMDHINVLTDEILDTFIKESSYDKMLFLEASQKILQVNMPLNFDYNAQENYIEKFIDMFTNDMAEIYYFQLVELMGRYQEDTNVMEDIGHAFYGQYRNPLFLAEYKNIDSLKKGDRFLITINTDMEGRRYPVKKWAYIVNIDDDKVDYVYTNPFFAEEARIRTVTMSQFKSMTYWEYSPTDHIITFKNHGIIENLINFLSRLDPVFRTPIRKILELPSATVNVIRAFILGGLFAFTRGTKNLVGGIIEGMSNSPYLFFKQFRREILLEVARALSHQLNDSITEISSKFLTKKDLEGFGFPLKLIYEILKKHLFNRNEKIDPYTTDVNEFNSLKEEKEKNSSFYKAYKEFINQIYYEKGEGIEPGEEHKLIKQTKKTLSKLDYIQFASTHKMTPKMAFMLLLDVLKQKADFLWNKLYVYGEKPVRTWSAKVYTELAEGLGLPPEEVVNESIKGSNADQVKYDDINRLLRTYTKLGRFWTALAQYPLVKFKQFFLAAHQAIQQFHYYDVRGLSIFKRYLQTLVDSGDDIQNKKEIKKAQNAFAYIYKRFGTSLTITATSDLVGLGAFNSVTNPIMYSFINLVKLLIKEFNDDDDDDPTVKQFIYSLPLGLPAGLVYNIFFAERKKEYDYIPTQMQIFLVLFGLMDMDDANFNEIRKLDLYEFLRYLNVYRGVEFGSSK